jgi:hypothetical protein
MVKSPKDQPPTPAQTSTPPAGYRQVVDQDFAISMLMELQKSVGAHDATLNHVSTDVTELKRVVGRLEKTIYAAAAVVAVVGGLIVWSVNTAKEVYLATHADRPASIAGPASPSGAAENRSKQQ